MLKHIPAILTPDLLKVLMEMGHGDEIVIADGNFPGAAIAKGLSVWTDTAFQRYSGQCCIFCRWIPIPLSRWV